jgi:hypothetical protein
MEINDLGVQAQIDTMLAVPALRLERHPFFRRSAGEVVLGQVRPVHRKIGIGADHQQATDIAFATQHPRFSEPGGTAAHNNDPRGLGAARYHTL